MYSYPLPLNIKSLNMHIYPKIFPFVRMISQTQVTTPLTLILFIYLFIYLFIFCFLGSHLQHMEMPGLRVNHSCCCQPLQQPQQHRIQAESNLHHSSRQYWSLIHRARPGIKPLSSWILAGSLPLSYNRTLLLL